MFADMMQNYGSSMGRTWSIPKRLDLHAVPIGHCAAYLGNLPCLRQWIEEGGAINTMVPKDVAMTYRVPWESSIGLLAAQGRDYRCVKAWFDAGGDPHLDDGLHLKIYPAGVNGYIAEAVARQDHRLLTIWLNAGGVILRSVSRDHPLPVARVKDRRLPFLVSHIGKQRRVTIADTIARLRPCPTDHGVIITQHLFGLMGYRMPDHDPSIVASAIAHPVGARLAQDVVPWIDDPMVMGLWIQRFVTRSS
jgi:hypothetical protein